MATPYLRIPLRRLALFSAGLLTLALASCHGPVPVDPAFKSNRKQKVAVITMQAPVASVHHVGRQGLVDLALNQAMATGGRRELDDYPSQARFDEVGKQFAKRLSGLGYKATHLAVHPTQKEFNPATAKPTAAKPIPGTGTYLAGYDAAVFLSMPAVGRAKMVYGFIPLSGSSAIAAMQGTMYATADQKLLWRSPIPMINPHDGIDIEGDGTEALFRAVDASVKRSAGGIEANFFNGF